MKVEERGWIEVEESQRMLIGKVEGKGAKT
jgi:hypothetical protein